MVSVLEPTKSGFTYTRVFNSLNHWFEQRPDQARLVRRTLLLASSWVWRRNQWPLEHPPWNLALILCPQLSDMCDAVLSAWDRMNVCCVPAGMAKQLKQEGRVVQFFQIAKSLSYPRCEVVVENKA